MGNCSGCKYNSTINKAIILDEEILQNKTGNNVKNIQKNNDNNSYLKQNSKLINYEPESAKLIYLTIGNNERKYFKDLKRENGTIYSGYIKNCMRDGPGELFWPNGSKYTGDWNEDKANGFGKLTLAEGDIYEGEMKNDKSHGQGIYLAANGSKYVGSQKIF